MPSAKIDSLVMLLSADWFFDRWGQHSIAAEEGVRSCVQRGCREIVKAFMGHADQYWLISFSSERIADTQNQFHRLTERCGLSRTALKRLRAIADQRDPDGKDAWLLLALTERVVREGGSTFKSRLDDGVVVVLKELWIEAVRDESITRNCVSAPILSGTAISVISLLIYRLSSLTMRTRTSLFDIDS